MGNRGPLPAIKRTEDERLLDLTPPKILGEHGKGYWCKHAQKAAENFLLTTQTADSFTMLCDLWEKYMEIRNKPVSGTYVNLVKSYQTTAKFFKTLPVDKPGRPGNEDRHDDKEEFTF